MAMSTQTNGGSSGPIGRSCYWQVAPPCGRVSWYSRSKDEEKRQCTRRSLRCEIVLVNDQMEDEGKARFILGECMNFSEGGLYGIVPIGFGVAIGQRYTFQLKIGECGPEPGLRNVVRQPGQIARTELLLGENGQPDRVGVAVKLTGHRSGTVPMPRLSFA